MVGVSRFLDTAAAAAYLGFRTRAGIRSLVYSGELVPDGRGYRGGYVFLPETLDAWVHTRMDLMSARRGRQAVPQQTERPRRVRGAVPREAADPIKRVRRTKPR